MSAELSRTPLSGADWFAVEFDPATEEVVMLDQRLLPSEVRYHRYAKPDEVANAVLFLASPLASGITGTALTVDAGLMAGNLPFVEALSQLDG